MSAENSTANSTWNNDARPNLTTPQKWQLAITVEFYFRYAVIAIGILGTAANALVLYALISYNAKQVKKRAVNLLIIHQNLMDLSSCVLLVISHTVAASTYLTGALGYFLCTIFVSESAEYCVLYSSVINLAMLTIERYLKVVHPFWSKKHLKRWMIYAAMAFAWITGIMLTIPVVFSTTVVQDGVCLSYFVWENPTVRMSFGVTSIFSLFVVPLVVFMYCYGRIVIVMRRQMRVMVGHNVQAGSAQANASQIQSKRIKWNIIKTMLIVTVAFMVCWCPHNIYFMVVEDSSAEAGALYIGYFPTVFLAYLNVCMNPFIYATKHEGVKEKLRSLAMCRKFKRHGGEDDSGTGSAVIKQTPTGVTHL